MNPNDAMMRDLFILMENIYSTSYGDDSIPYILVMM